MEHATTTADPFALIANQILGIPAFDTLPGQPGRVHLGPFSDPAGDREPLPSSEDLYAVVFGE